MTDLHPFDRAVQLTAIEPGLWRGEAIKAYGNMVGAFGGIVGASLLNAVLSDDRHQGHPVALTVNFCAALALGGFEIRSVLQRGGKHTQHWSLELHQNDAVCATASVVMGTRNDVFSHQPVTRPEVPDYTTCTPMPVTVPLNWLKSYEFRFVSGAPVTKPRPEPGPALSVLWLRDAPPRPLDYLSLAALSDCFLLRLFHVRGEIVPMGTVSLTTHFLATPDELAQQDTVPVLGQADSLRFHGNFHDQQMQLWGQSGKLLASGSQIVWYRQ